MKSDSKLINWLEKEKLKDQVEINLKKNELINSIKKLNKEDILPKPKKSLTIWQKLKKVLLGL
jgi:hypothetical protein